MNLADEISGGIVAKPHRILLHGEEGDGKSTFASQANDPIFVPTEDRLGHIPCNAFFKRRVPPYCTSYEEYISCLTWLGTENHSFQTVVTDTVDGLEKLIWADVCRQRKVENIKDIKYQDGFTFALVQWAEVMACLDALRTDRGMTVILLAHTDVEKHQQPGIDTYQRYTPLLHKLSSEAIRNWCDEVLFIAHKVYTTSTDEGFGRTRTKGIGTGEKTLKTTQRPSHVAKNSIAGLPDELPFEKDTSWQTFAQYLPKSV